MPNRTAKFVSAVFASVLAGISLTTASHSATPAADDCLSAPREQTPEGSHWYYRIERGTKRHCWYLREEGEKVSQSAPSSAAPSAKPVAPKAEPAIRGSVADARAELPVTSARDAADGSAAAAPQPSATGLNSISPTVNQPVTAPAAGAQSTVIASRWPEPSSANPSAADPAPAAAETDASDVQPTPPAAAPPPPPVALAAADAPTEKSQGRSGSIPMLSVVMIGALLLAGLIGSAIVRLGGRRRRQNSAIGVDRDAIWDAIRTEPTSSPAFPGAAAHMPRPRAAADMPRRPGFTLPRELQMADHAAADRQDDRIADMLARLARSATR
ncbi:MAG TPA: hypothetical protein VGM09_26980 [Bradyrhizobium sp.]|jgi:hypothetical protein